MLFKWLCYSFLPHDYVSLKYELVQEFVFGTTRSLSMFTAKVPEKEVFALHSYEVQERLTGGGWTVLLEQTFDRAHIHRHWRTVYGGIESLESLFLSLFIYWCACVYVLLLFSSVELFISNTETTRELSHDAHRQTDITIFVVDFPFFLGYVSSSIRNRVGGMSSPSLTVCRILFLPSGVLKFWS